MWTRLQSLAGSLRDLGGCTRHNSVAAFTCQNPGGGDSDNSQRALRVDKGGRTMPFQAVRLYIQDHHVVMDNGTVQVTLSKPAGLVTGIRYDGIDNLLEVLNRETNRGYWDLHWNPPGGKGIFDVISGTSFRVVVENDEQVELSFTRMWDSLLEGKYIPLNIDKRFILLRGSSGFYSYAIYKHLQEWPGFDIGETRITFKLRKDMFQYMAIADNRQRLMPLPDDLLPGRCQTLAYPEAVILVNPELPELTGEVDDKYQYSCENKDNQVHGWICFKPLVGFWQITPSDEFRTAGPLKQNLTSHVGPTTLAMFHSSHYAGKDLVLSISPGEPWKKVFGPVFNYLNSASNGEDAPFLWEDAKMQMMAEVQSWPYSFPVSEDFQKSEERGNVCGRLLVKDRNIKCKDYQFWTRADENAYFSIKSICTGDYNLYAWVPGFLGDYRFDAIVNIISGCDMDMGDLVYEPPRDGPTLWEIGIPDRSAAEFYIPDPDPKFMNNLYANHPDRLALLGLTAQL
ncbi:RHAMNOGALACTURONATE LYASE FAMILY PROTEIN [Salix koriyanagi]|uniref:rhamnogalacturonan endolyase n=1 Tax=Salix koriyanagi TaxID=2511006 RepID=A0A9Q0P5K2_9ROSI|nr:RHAMNOGALACTURONATE LYASE FAMILY PROTEIN [Salix koriyanagi]